jgi:hypothetical protein
MADTRELSSVIQIDGDNYNIHAKTAEKVDHSLVIKGNNTEAIKYDGSSNKTLNIVGSGGTSVTTSAGGTITISSTAGADNSSELVEGEYKSSTSFSTANGNAIGETGKLYVDTSANKIYRWNGSAFIEVSQAQNAFSKIAVNGQSTVSANKAIDTLTLIAGSNVTITTNATDDSITIAATGGGTGNGDMLKSVYDTNNNGKIDVAENAEKLGGTSAADYATKKYVDDADAKKQNKLVSGTDIKTINGMSLLGSGDITIASGGGTGNGDMLKSVYATGNANNTNKIDKAINAEQLGGVAASNYAKKSDIPSITVSQEEPTGGATGDIWFKY